MHVNPRALFPLGICVAVMMFVLSRPSSKSDSIVQIAEWTILGVMSFVAVVKMVRGRHMSPYGQQDTVPGRIRRWVLGE